MGAARDAGDSIQAGPIQAGARTRDSGARDSGAAGTGATSRRAEDDRRTSQLLASHAVLALAWVGWRALESTPGLASAWGGTFAASVAGRGLALATLVAGVLAASFLVVRTLQRWRDPRATGLFLALVAAIPARAGIDVFDLTYVGLVALIATAWFEGRRRQRAQTAA